MSQFFVIMLFILVKRVIIDVYKNRMAVNWMVFMVFIILLYLL